MKMLTLLNPFLKCRSLVSAKHQRIISRTFLSQAYYCNEVWDNRLNSAILQKVNLDELYYDLDQKYQKTNTISAVDVDVFANGIKDDLYLDELLDLIHKLRLSADTSNTLNSTPHALMRFLTRHGRNSELLNILDDRLNYGMFLDHYTANLLMDSYWKSKDSVSGARVASQLMLQEDVDHSLSSSLSLLHCYTFLQNPQGWPQHPKPEEPEEEVKIRVKYLRNPYDDDHFDLRDSHKIVGKTISMITKHSSDIIDKSFYIVGLALFGKHEQAMQEVTTSSQPLCKEILQLLPEEIKSTIGNISTQSMDVSSILEERVKKAESEIAEKDIAKQCALFSDWEEERMKMLQNQQERLVKAKRLADIEVLQKDIKTKEQKLWFFENEEQIELDTEAKQIFYPKKWFGKKKKPRKVDEGYVPPEI